MNREELLKIAKPVLFNTEMVRAILEGRKTVTRRVVKPQPDGNHNHLLGYVVDSTCKKDIGRIAFGIDEFGGNIQYAKLPFSENDYLYVRETWCDDRQFTHDDTAGQYFFKASFPIEGWSDVKEFKWRPSIHMPKEAARLFLKVTDVRVERLQMMNGKDVLKEGVDNGSSNPTTGYRFDVMQRMAFKDLWNSTIKKADLDKYGWEANPWVWVVEFERVEV